MGSSDEILGNISRLTDRLIDKNQKLKKENEYLLRERDRLVEESIKLTSMIQGYKKEESIKNIYTSFVIGEGDKLKAKRQLEKILREIDGCIDKLNSKK